MMVHPCDTLIRMFWLHTGDRRMYHIENVENSLLFLNAVCVLLRTELI